MGDDEQTWHIGQPSGPIGERHGSGERDPARTSTGWPPIAANR
jgi:hypothetical protein